MKAAIYARKSKDTQKGESTAHQIARCKSMCEVKEWEYEVYEDYGISGKDTERPEFQRMMADISAGKIHTLVCYKLDRVSRSVNDFSTLIHELTDMEVGFISLKENFDTSTPMGRAMMLITSVFAQLERETIAERVRDNMVDRAKTGKWNGGPVPLGYDAEKTQYTIGGKTIKGSALVVNEEKAELVQKIFKAFLQEKAIRGTTNLMNSQGYKGRDDNPFNQSSMRRLLTNPVYCVADERAYDFFVSRGMQVVDDRSKFDGQYGIICYNRRKQKKKTTAERPVEEWLIAVGEHKGIVDSATFIEAHNIMVGNRPKSPRVGTGLSTPFSGIPIKCGECGSPMYISPGKKNSKDDSYAYVYFRCGKKIRQESKSCDLKNVRADLLETVVFGSITELLKQNDKIEEAIEAYKAELQKSTEGSEQQIAHLRKSITKVEQNMRNLVDALSLGTLPDSVIKSKYQELTEQKADLEAELNDLLIMQGGVDVANINVDLIKRAIEKLEQTDGKQILDMDFDDRKALYHSIISKIEVFKDRTAKVYFNLGFGSESTTTRSQNLNSITFTSTVEIAEDFSVLPEDTFADRLNKYIKTNGLYIKYFADDVGVTEETMHNILKGKTSPSASTYNKIVQAYPDVAN